MNIYKPFSCGNEFEATLAIKRICKKRRFCHLLIEVLSLFPSKSCLMPNVLFWKISIHLRISAHLKKIILNAMFLAE